MFRRQISIKALGIFWGVSIAKSSAEIDCGFPRFGSGLHVPRIMPRQFAPLVEEVTAAVPF
jgi:hypothetical protein